MLNVFIEAVYGLSKLKDESEFSKECMNDILRRMKSERMKEAGKSEPIRVPYFRDENHFMNWLNGKE
jgi:hypothetical protein